MNTRRKLLIAAATLVLGTGVASAAVTRSDLNMRSGPGTDTSVVAVIPGGASVSVLRCASGWCRVRYAGRVGYASEQYLEDNGTAVRPPVATYGPMYTDPYAGFAYPYTDPYAFGWPDYSFSYGPSIGLGFWRGAGRHHWRAAPHWRGVPGRAANGGLAAQPGGHRGIAPGAGGRGSGSIGPGTVRQGRGPIGRGGGALAQGPRGGGAPHLGAAGGRGAAGAVGGNGRRGR